MAQESKSRKLDQYIVRFPDGLRDRIKDAASHNNRSMNAEIVATLEEKYPEPSPTRRIEDLLREWAPKILGEKDHAKQGELITELNEELAKISRQARVGIFPTEDGHMLGLVWQTSMFDDDGEDFLHKSRKIFPPTKFTRWD